MAVSGRREAHCNTLLGECRAAFDWWERFACSRASIALMLIWAVGEATVWPIIPDFLLVPLVAANRRRSHVLLAAAIAGMALGGIALYLVSYADPHHAELLLRYLPLVNDRQIETAHRYLTAHGVVGFFYQPWSGSPFKVWAIIAARTSITPWLAIPIFIVARGARMAIVASVTRVLAGVCRRFMRDFSLFVAPIYLVVFFYGWWSITLH